MFYLYSDINQYNDINNTRFKSFYEVENYLNSVDITYYNLINAIYDGHAELVHHILHSIDIQYLLEFKINDILQPIFDLWISPYVLDVILNDIGDYLDLNAILYRIEEDYDIDTMISRSDLVTVLMNYIINTRYITDFYMVSSLVVVFAAVDDEDMFRQSIEHFLPRISNYDLRYMIDFLKYIENGDKYTKILLSYFQPQS
jgi:hypothetical protein